MTDFLQFVMNFFLFILWMCLYAVMLERKYRPAVTIGFEALILAVFMLIPYMSERFAPVRSSLFPVIVFLPAIFLYKDGLLKKLLQGFICLIVTVVMELTMALIMPEGFDTGASTNTALSYIAVILYLFGNAVLLGLYSLIMRRFKSGADKKDGILIAVLTLSQIYLAMECASLVLKYRTEFGWRIFFLLLAVALTFASIILLLTRFAKNAEERARSRFLIEQVDIMKRYYGYRSEQYQKQRKMAHDISNHMLAVRSLIAQGKVAEAEQYAKSIVKEKETFDGEFSCANDIAASFLYNRLLEIKETGTRVEVNVHLKENTGISDTDLVAVFGNLLDNASEACRDTEDPFVRLTVMSKDGFLLIRTENRYLPDVSEKEERVPGLERGLGKHIMAEIAERYSGLYEAEGANGIFTASVYLKEKTENA